MVSCPLLPLAVGTAFPAGEHRHSPPPVGGNLPSPWARRFPPVNTGTLRRRSAAIFPRRGYGTPRRRSAAIVHALRGRKVASTGCAAVSAEGLPSADGKKERAAVPVGTICKMFTFEPLTQNEKTAYII